MLLVWLLIPAARIIPLPFKLLGLFLFLGGGGIALASKRLFQRTGSPMPSYATPVQLHTGGAFRFSRNPMYLGIAIGLLGIALFSGSWLNLLFPLLFLLIVDRRFVPEEEANLAREFGEEYAAYCSRVRRWF